MLQKLQVSISTLLITALAIPSFVGAEEAVSLEWKINESKIIYKTDLSPTNQSENFIDLDFDKIYEENGITDEVKKKISGLKFPEDMNMITIMERVPTGNIRTTSYFQNWEMPDFGTEKPPTDNEDLKKFTKLMNSAPQLDAEINNKGKVQSFYLPQKQKNMIALIHELPETQVQIGDTWDINMYCIEMGAGFTAEYAKRFNRVELTDITIDNEKNLIAVVEYMLTEKVSGKVINPMTMKKVDTEMTCSYIGQHNFYVDKGYWKSINGEMLITSKGPMKSHMRQRVAMSLIEKLPEGISHK